MVFKYWADPYKGSQVIEQRLLCDLACCHLRRLKGEVLRDLPPKTEITLDVELGEAERAAYETLLARVRDPDSPPRTISFSAPLVIRASTGNGQS